MKRGIVIVTFIGIVIGIISGFIVNYYQYDKKGNDNSVSVIEEDSYWRNLIKMIGIKSAYSKFKFQYDGKISAHKELHRFASLMYEEEGLNGITYCDDSFAMGCYHGFFISAISTEGTGVINKLDKICFDTFGARQSGCQHGIGHGIMEYVGHNNLTKALDICAKLIWQGKIFGCNSGAFMEYNFPLSIGGKLDSQTMRKYIPEDPYFPCNSVDARFQKACFHELGQYLQVVHKNDYKKLGKICGALIDEGLKTYCFLSLGWYAPQGFTYNVSNVVISCNLMPDQKSKTLCKIAAAHELRGDTHGDQDKIDLICADLIDDVLETCRKGTFYAKSGIIFDN